MHNIRDKFVICYTQITNLLNYDTVYSNVMLISKCIFKY